MVDKFTRPSFAITGLLGTIICLAVEAAMVAISQHSANKAVLQAGVAMIFLFGVAYGCFLDGMLLLWVGEIYPTPYRAKGFNIGMGTQALCQIAWTGAAPTAFA